MLNGDNGNLNSQHSTFLPWKTKKKVEREKVKLIIHAKV